MKLTEGDSIFYTGDRANAPAWTTITEVHVDSLNQPVYVALRPDETEERWTIHVGQIGEVYHGHCDPRFVTAEAYKAYYAEVFAEIGSG